MRSIFDILHKNFQEDQLNSGRFPGFPAGFLNSRRFPAVVDTLLYTVSQKNVPTLKQYGSTL